MTLLIHEEDQSSGTQTIIGLASDMENVDRMIGEYYGEYTQISHRDVQDSGIECVKVIETEALCCPERATITVMNFKINEV